MPQGNAALRHEVLGLRSRVQGLGLGVFGLHFRVLGLRLRVWDFGSMVVGFGLRFKFLGYSELNVQDVLHPLPERSQPLSPVDQVHKTGTLGLRDLSMI